MKRIFLFLFIIVALLCSCSPDAELYSAESGELTIATWNVQNLFNATDDGTEYREYSSSSGWNIDNYKARLRAIDTVLGYEGIGQADILVINEVENESVAKDLLRLSSLKKRGFCHYALCSEDNGAISICVLSRIPVTDAKVHGITGARPVLETVFEVEGRKVILFSVHAKSNLGDEEENIGLRKTLGKVLEKRVLEAEKLYPHSLIIAAGDFNEDWDDGNVIVKPDMWYSMWDDISVLVSMPGSYCYMGQWHSYDNVVLRGKNHYIIGCDVCNKGILTNSNGLPDAFIRNLLCGVSDHLPVWITVSL